MTWTVLAVYVSRLDQPRSRSDHFQFESQEFRQYRTADTSIVNISFPGADITSDAYLRSCIHIVKKLKEAGARVVLIPVTGSQLFFPQSDIYFRQAEIRDSLYRKIHAFGIAVFGLFTQRSSFVIGDEPFDRIGAPWGVISIMPYTENWNIPRFYPLKYQRRKSSEWTTIPDVSLIVVQKYFECESENSSSLHYSTVIGNIQRSLFRDGTALIPRIPHNFSEELESRMLGDTATFYRFEWTGKADSFYYKSVPISDQEWRTTYSQKVRDKIVILAVRPEPSLTSPYGFYHQSLSRIIHQIKDETLIRPAEGMDVLVALLFFTGCAVICSRFKPHASILPIILLFIIFYFGYRQFSRFNNSYWNIMLLMISLPIGLITFPVIKTFHEKGKLEQDQKKRILAELQAAHDMQMGLMPASDPIITGFDVSGICQPAQEVGGDYFDYVWLDEGKTKFGIAIADVSGKGMKAAMTAVMTSGMIYREINKAHSPKTILMEISKPLYLKMEKRMFTSLSFGVIDIKEKTLTLSNAGQLQPILKRNGVLEYIKVEGSRLPLGVIADINYGEATKRLLQGDLLIFITDGITEAMNEDKELFGFERVEQFLMRLPAHLSSEDAARGLINEASKFAGRALQHDDMTVVVVKVL